MTTVEIRFEGRPVSARIGDTIAASLTACGELGLRHTSGGDLRGMFCGMGVCQDCLVVVDGTPDLRACMTKVTGRHDIRRQPALTPLSIRTAAPPDAPELPVETPDLAILGGGAGGLAAACVAAESGLDVLVIDERPVAGGQYFKQPTPGRTAGDTQAREGARLIGRARASGGRFLDGATVWGAFAPLELALTAPDGPRLVRPRRLIVATGAFERSLPVPGWTLPGVMTTGAAQTLLRSYGVVAGQRILVAGNGPLNLQVALELARAGAQVVAVAELAPRPTHPTALFDMALSSPGLLAKGFEYAATLRRRGIRLLYRHCLRAVEARTDGLRARLAAWDGARLGDGPAFDVDVVTMGYGFLPADDVFRALGAAQIHDPRHRHLRTVRDADCRTSVEHVFGVGDGCGLGGAHAARAEGVIAGLSAVTSLGRTPTRTLASEGKRARRSLRRHRRFQRGLWSLFEAVDPSVALATHDTLVCRCESVTRAMLDAAMAEGATSIGAIKRLTRAGMGGCQGRYCAPHLAALIAARGGPPVDEDAFFAPRPPIRPIRIGDLIGMARTE